MVLIHGRDAAAFDAVMSSFRSLAGEVVRDVRLHELPGVIASDGCQVVATNRPGRPGIWAQSPVGSYKWSQDTEGWLQVAELAVPVRQSIGESGAHFQHLEGSGEATVIISTEPAW